MAAKAPPTHDGGMLGKALVALVVAVSVALVAASWVEDTFGGLESDRLVDRLDELPVPPVLTPIDERARDGSFRKERKAEATRIYAAPGRRQEICAMLRRFYEEGGFTTRTVVRGASDPASCGLAVIVGRTSVDIGVDENRHHESLFPEGLAGLAHVVEVRYHAVGR